MLYIVKNKEAHSLTAYDHTYACDTRTETRTTVAAAFV